MKRVTCKRTYPTNELLIYYLKQYKEAERLKNESSRMIFTYGLAINSLKAFPLEIKDADDLRQLKFFGDVLVKKLKKCFDEFRQSHGEPTYELLEQYFPSISNAAASKQKKKVEKTVSKDPMPKRTKSGEFTPQKGSGSYAMLRALYDDAVFNGGFDNGGLLLEDLRQASDIYSREAMVKSSAVQHYTPFSCLTTLTKKGLVKRHKVGHKDVVSLTEDGFKLASTLAQDGDIEQEEVVSTNLALSASTSTKQKNAKKRKSCVDISDESVKPAKFSKTVSASCINGKDFTSSIKDNKDRNVSCLSDNDDETDNILPLSERVKKKLNCPFGNIETMSNSGINDLPGPSSKIKSDYQKQPVSVGSSKSFGDFGYVYVCSDLSTTNRKDNAFHVTDATLGVNIVWIKTSEKYLLAQNSLLFTLSQNVGVFEEPYVLANLYEEHGSDIAPGFLPVNVNVNENDKNCFSNNEISKLDCRSTVPKNYSSQENLKNFQEIGVENSSDSQYSTSVSSFVNSVIPDSSFVLEPNNFDIILVVDNAEVKGGVAMNGETDANRRDLLSEYLLQKQIVFETRKLNVGDYLWIARKRHDENGPELVLDIVVERKRIDDLGNSIKDGRWNSQKYRLKRCGIRKVVYVFESLPKSVKYFGFNPVALRSAMTNAEIQDRFCVEKTAHLKETVDYIARMTKFLIETFKSKRLSCRKFAGEDVPESDGILDTESFSQNLLRFDDFQKLAEKPRHFTIGETFALCLSQISGVSMELARDISDKFGTFQGLLNAYQLCGDDDKAKIALLQDITSGAHGRRLGPKLSRKIANFFSSKIDCRI